MTATMTTPKVPCRFPASDVPGGSIGKELGSVGSAFAVEDMSKFAKGRRCNRCPKSMDIYKGDLNDVIMKDQSK